MLISLNISTGVFEAAATTLNYLNAQLKENKTTEDFSIVASPVYTWLFKYPFEINNTINYRDNVTIKTPHVISVVDGSFRSFIEPYEKIVYRDATNILDDNDLRTRFVGRSIGTWIKIDLGGEKKVCGIKLWWYKGDSRSYNFTLSTSNDNRTFTEIASYQSNARTVSERYESNNTVGRYLDIHFNGNSDNDVGSISEIALYGSYNVSNSGQCSELVRKKIAISNNSYIETGGNKRIEQIVRILSESKVISKISPPRKYDSRFYPFTSTKYSSISSMDITVK